MAKNIVVTPTTMTSRLRVSDKRRDSVKVRRVLLRWMQRAAERCGRFINEPSLDVQLDRDPSLRQSFLYVWADSITNTAPEFLRRYRVDRKTFNIAGLE